MKASGQSWLIQAPKPGGFEGCVFAKSRNCPKNGDLGFLEADLLPTRVDDDQVSTLVITDLLCFPPAHPLGGEGIAAALESLPTSQALLIRDHFAHLRWNEKKKTPKSAGITQRFSNLKPRVVFPAPQQQQRGSTCQVLQLSVVTSHPAPQPHLLPTGFRHLLKHWENRAG